MSLSLAIKRSYRNFIPPSVRNPRQLVRDLWPSIFLYTIGLFTGLTFSENRGNIEKITGWTTATFVTLLIIKWWAYAPSSRHVREEEPVAAIGRHNDERGRTADGTDLHG